MCFLGVILKMDRELRYVLNLSSLKYVVGFILVQQSPKYKVYL